MFSFFSVKLICLEAVIFAFFKKQSYNYSVTDSHCDSNSVSDSNSNSMFMNVVTFIF